MKPIVLLFTLFATINCNAQNFANIQHTALWGIKNSNGDTSYLFGTFHDLGDSYFDKYPVIKTELRKTHTVVLESVNATAKGKAEKTDYSSWYDSIAPKDFDLINNFFKKGAKTISRHARLSLSEFKRANYSPLDVYVLFQHTEIYVQCGIHLEKNEQPMEDYLTDWCRYHSRHRIPLIGLETSVDVNSNVFGIKDKDIVDSMKTAILNPPKDIGCSFIDTYRNMTGLNYQFETRSETIDTNNVYLLNQRNDKWVPEIKKIVDAGPSFIAVGLFHLAYYDGLINQLKAAGYQIFPIPMKAL